MISQTLAQVVSWMRRVNQRLEAVLGPRRVSLSFVYRDSLRAASSQGPWGLHLGAGEDRWAYRDDCARQPLVSLDVDHEGLTRNPNALRVIGDAHALPFQAGSFSLVFGEYVFEHLRDPWCVLQEVHRVLKSGGQFVVLVPNPRHYFSWVARITPHWIHQAIASLPSMGHDHVHATHHTYYRWGRWEDFPTTASQLGWELTGRYSEPGPTAYTQPFPFHILFVLLDRLLSRWPAWHAGYVVVFRKPG